MCMRSCFHLNTVFTTGLKRMRGINSLHLNLQQSQEVPADYKEQGQYHHRSHPHRKEKLKKS